MRNDFLVTTNGVRMPRIIYGTAWKKDKTAACVQKALTLGFRGIDTACQPKHYFEPGVGDGIAAFLAAKGSEVARADLYLQTKFTPLSGQDPHRIPYDPQAPLAEQIEQSFRTSLGNLRTDYLDCLVLHSPLRNAQETQSAWRVMESLVAQGGVRQLGISNCYDASYFENLHRWARIKPAVVQNRFYEATGYDRELRAFCARNGIVYQTFWTLSANPHVLAHDTVQALSSKLGRTPAQVLFRALTQEGVVPLTGTQSEVHMREDLDIFDFELTDAERAAVMAIFS
jgi:diketogulonate reductase-like aldo/keto reductase